MRGCRLCPPITLHQLADALGMPWCEATRLRLYRELRAKEKATGETLLWNKTPGGRLYTTEAVVSRYFEKWVDKRGSMLKLVRKELEDVTRLLHLTDAKIAGLAKEMGSRLSAHGARLRQLEQTNRTVRQSTLQG